MFYSPQFKPRILLILMHKTLTRKKHNDFVYQRKNRFSFRLHVQISLFSAFTGQLDYLQNTLASPRRWGLLTNSSTHTHTSKGNTMGTSALEFCSVALEGRCECMDRAKAQLVFLSCVYMCVCEARRSWACRLCQHRLSAESSIQAPLPATAY